MNFTKSLAEYEQDLKTSKKDYTKLGKQYQNCEVLTHQQTLEDLIELVYYKYSTSKVPLGVLCASATTGTRVSLISKRIVKYMVQILSQLVHQN